MSAEPSGAPARAPATSPVTTSSTTLRLSRGEIPRTWSTPAEAASSMVPAPASRTSPALALAGVGGLAVLVALGVWGVRTATPTKPTATTVASTPAAPSAPPRVEAIPAPPPTSSTAPSQEAPEDQGGDDEGGPAPTPAPTPAPAVATTPRAAPAASGDVVTELPVRKKAKALTAKAIGALRGGDFAAAEPVLVRAVLIDPTFADGWRHLGIARAQLGDRDGARRAYKKYLALAPDAPDAAQVKAILAQ